MTRAPKMTGVTLVTKVTRATRETRGGWSDKGD